MDWVFLLLIVSALCFWTYVFVSKYRPAHARALRATSVSQHTSQQMYLLCPLRAKVQASLDARFPAVQVTASAYRACLDEEEKLMGALTTSLAEMHAAIEERLRYENLLVNSVIAVGVLTLIARILRFMV